MSQLLPEALPVDSPVLALDSALSLRRRLLGRRWPTLKRHVAALVVAVSWLAASSPTTGFALEQSFAPAQDVAPTIDGPRYLAVDDLDRDGDLDIVGIADSGGEILWWENGAGDGSSWLAHSIEASWPLAKSVAVADLDGDGDSDVVSGSGGTPGILAWWESVDGTGLSWTYHEILQTSGIQMRDLDCADVDLDGDIDVLAADFARNDVVFFSNDNADGTAWTEVPVDTDLGDARSLAWVDDFDLDGNVDLVAAGSNHDEITLYRSENGGSSWFPHSLTTTFDGASGADFGDIDGDGDLDVVGSALSADEVRWWVNDGGPPSSWSDQLIDDTADGVRNVEVVDLDRDGDLDLVGAVTFGNTVRWWENTAGDGSTWAVRSLAGAVDLVEHALATDLDGDGDLDIVASSFLGDRIVWFENVTERLGDVDFIPRAALGTAADGGAAVDLADMDHDGQLDVVVAAPGDDLVAWYRNNGSGSSWTSMTVDSEALGAADLEVSDLDRDGDLDIVGALADEDKVVWWESDQGGWTRHDLWSPLLAANGVGVADFDRDGTRDVVCTATTNGNIGWIENVSGDATTVVTSTFRNTTGAGSAGVAEIDGDGWLDVIATNTNGTLFSINNLAAGTGSDFLNQSIVGFFNGAADIAAGDIDRDGAIDLAAVASVGNEVAWWSNRGDIGLNWTVKVTLSSDLVGATAIALGDLDRDGDLDVVAVGSTEGRLAWWEQTESDWLEHTVTSTLHDPSILALGDLDGDGDLDIVSDDGSQFRWWENTKVVAELFADGFESGDVSAWSDSTP